MAIIENKGVATSSKSKLDEIIVRLAQGTESKRPHKTIQLVHHPMLQALKRCSTQHIYTDTAVSQELNDLLVTGESKNTIEIIAEINGNTTNQALVSKVLESYLSATNTNEIENWAKKIIDAEPRTSLEEATACIYTIINGRLGRNIMSYYGSGKNWDLSLELHTGLASNAEASKRVARYLAQMVPGTFVKVAFTPHHPHAFLIARDLEREGIPVNFTTTFSVRQVLAAAILANVTRTNIFMGRLNQGLQAKLLGEQVDLVAQRSMRQLRQQLKVKTLLIVASVRTWETLIHAAGCDVFTVPYKALKEFLTQEIIAPQEIKNCLNNDYSDKLGISGEVLTKIGQDKISLLYQIEAEYLEFLKAVRNAPDFDELDGETLYKRFDEAGYGDIFYSPTALEWQDLRKSKLPDLGSPLTEKLPLDTLYSLLANADFMKFQDEMDARIARMIENFFK